MRITEKDVAYVAKLANLEVPEPEGKELSEQLSRIVDYVEKLNALEVTGVEPTAQVTADVKHGMREDQVETRTGSSVAGKTVKLFRVPKVITER